MLNSSIIYQLFVKPIFIPAITAVIGNPLFFLPSIALNYILFQKYYIYFYSRSLLVNMYLKPNGKQIIVETLDGESKVINNMDIYKAEAINTKWGNRIDLYHGANNFIYIKGNTHAFDSEILTAILTNNFIDVKNVAYDYDVTTEFTWDFKELVEIKKRKRIVNRFYRPTIKILTAIISSRKFEQAKALGLISTKRQILKPFNVYSLQVD